MRRWICAALLLLLPTTLPFAIAQEPLREEIKKQPAEHVSGTMSHAEIRLGSTMMSWAKRTSAGDRLRAFHLFVENCDEVYAAALRAGATFLYEPVDKPYGERPGGVTDPWGNQWYIATPLTK